MRAAASGACYLAYTTATDLALIPLWRSTDLATWERIDNRIGVTPVMPDLAPWTEYGRHWAPSVLERPNNPDASRFVMWYTAHQRGSTRQCLGMATAASPFGPFVDVSTGPAYCQTNGTIDANPFVDDDGTPYLLYKSENPAQILISRLTDDGRAIVGGTEQLLWQSTAVAGDDPVVEGPNMLRADGRIYLFYSTGSWWTSGYRVGVAQCDGVAGPCSTKYGSAVLASRGGMLGPGGQTPFLDTAGAWHLMFHAWTSPYVGYPSGARSLHMLALVFSGGNVYVG